MTTLDKISQLEIRDYGHDDCVEEIMFYISLIIKVANPKDSKHEKEIEGAILNLLEKCHYDGELTEHEIEQGYHTRKVRKKVELLKLNDIIEEHRGITKKLEKIQTNWIKNTDSILDQ